MRIPMKLWKQVVSLTLLLSFLAAVSDGQRKRDQTVPGDASLAARINRFTPTVLTADTSHLALNDRKALAKIIAAAKYLDPLYRRQVWSGNEALLKKLERYQDPVWAHYFRINAGPWSRLDNNEPFVKGVPPKPPQGSFYPDDMTKEEFNSWLNTLSAEEKEKATGYFYVIRRDANGKLKTVPYSEEYREFLEPAARLLRQAAALTINASLRNFLNKRAAAFAS